MAKNTYQSYTEQTPISTFRADFMRRGAMCSALANHKPALASVAEEAQTIVIAIDLRLAGLQHAEDAEVVNNALEDAEKLDVVDIYTELRRTMHAKNYDIATLLPDAPSALGRLGVESFTKRTEAAIANLTALPDTDPIRLDFLRKLERELAEFHNADAAEDATRAALKTSRLALTLYKSELVQTREGQLGTILTVLKDREKVALFTLPWRKASREAPETPPTP